MITKRAFRAVLIVLASALAIGLLIYLYNAL